MEEAKKASISELLQKLSSREEGLSTSEVKERLQQYGYNELIEKKTSSIVIFLTHFWGPIPWMIEVAVILSAILGDFADFGIILSLLIVNAVVGFWEENKADNAIELLKKKLALKARVLRDGKWLEAPARELVPGDVLRIRLGDIVPADAKLVNGDYLMADESALTGESLPVEKHVSDITYSGSVIRQGEMNALVFATGMNTYFGKTAKLVEEAETESHFQKAVLKIGDYLMILAIIMVSIIFPVSFVRNQSFLTTLKFGLVLVVAAIPAALPAVLSITMAVGAMVLVKKKAIVSKLVAIEEMAGMDVLCSDKTGTITKNDLTIGEVKPFAGFTDNDLLLFSTLASREEDQDPIDNAIIAKAKSLQILQETVSLYKITEFKPFDPVSKRTEATVEYAEGTSFKVAKGAPQVILSLVADKDAISAEVEKFVDTFAAKGYRALGVAKTNGDEKWQFVGLVSIYDPPREDSAETIKTAQSMGINVKMITGDHIAIAKEIAQQVNLGIQIATSSSFEDKSDEEAKHIVEDVDGFAQVFPEDKYHIVELFQSGGHIVGMTGDGVNDAPALKKANVGIAVAGATDAAKSAADIVLTEPGLSVIIDAVKESRRIFQRMNNYAIYRIAETVRVLFFITLTIVLFNFYPVTAFMIVLIALLNDIPIMMIAYDNVRYSNKPEPWNMHLVLSIATFLGLVGVVSSFIIYFIGKTILNLKTVVLQSFIFLKLAVAGHLTIFQARTRGHFWSIKPDGRLLWSTAITKVFATLIVLFGWYLAPIGFKLALLVWGYALAAFVLTDFAKVRFYKIL